LPEGRPPRVVADTNVLVSAILQPHGASGRILQAWRDGVIDLVVCPASLRELGDVLARPRLRKRVSSEEAETFVSLLRRQAELRADPVFEPGLTRDPKDDYIVALAAATKAICVVSGDDDLLSAANVAPRVLTPADFLEWLPNRETGGSHGA
jgi:putative PIN family toxin of toxin-antitoxin system